MDMAELGILGVGIARPPGAMPGRVTIPRLIPDELKHPRRAVAQIRSEGAEPAEGDARGKQDEADRKPNYRGAVAGRRHEYLGDAACTGSDSDRYDPKAYQS